ncbi:hypothetical protein MNBD_GAMMA10-1178 [hydrothermal vent metagenome]|uniref:HNH nuclease domain-containing protein n=1 Tax=hydrothermal vent metagenome TaxID=652676 RepID=A0A3B0XZX1_9ZZZZ
MQYRSGKAKDNSKLKQALLTEQKYFCAYTEIYCDNHSSTDIEHFNPTLKNKADDHYENWYAVTHHPNMIKGRTPRWESLQPVPNGKKLHELSSDIGYDIDEHTFYSLSDTQTTKNLIELIQINYEPYISDRKKQLDYLIFSKKHWKGEFSDFLKSSKGNLSFYSMLKEVFNEEIELIKKEGLFPI